MLEFCYLHSGFLPLPSNALALAANQYASHAMRRFAALVQRGVRSVPARVVGIVPGGTAFALVALAA